MRRRLIAGYLQCAANVGALCAAVARALGVAESEVVRDSADVDESASPTAFVEVTAEPGDFATRFFAFIDPGRVTMSDEVIVAAIAREAGVALLYDDGAATAPDRWIRVDPDGARYEVFDVHDEGDLRIDPSRGERRVD